MKNILNRILLPSLSSDWSPLVCTLLGQWWRCISKLRASNPAMGNLHELHHVLGHKGNLFVLLCSNWILSPFVGSNCSHFWINERAEVMQL